jgi:hypothetical protein
MTWLAAARAFPDAASPTGFIGDWCSQCVNLDDGGCPILALALHPQPVVQIVQRRTGGHVDRRCTGWRPHHVEIVNNVAFIYEAEP